MKLKCNIPTNFYRREREERKVFYKKGVGQIKTEHCVKNTSRKIGLENPENHRDTEFAEFFKLFSPCSLWPCGKTLEAHSLFGSARSAFSAVRFCNQIISKIRIKALAPLKPQQGQEKPWPCRN